jgi:hypothetical protein
VLRPVLRIPVGGCTVGLPPVINRHLYTCSCTRRRRREVEEGEREEGG